MAGRFRDREVVGHRVAVREFELEPLFVAVVSGKTQGRQERLIKGARRRHIGNAQVDMVVAPLHFYTENRMGPIFEGDKEEPGLRRVGGIQVESWRALSGDQVAVSDEQSLLSDDPEALSDGQVVSSDDRAGLSADQVRLSGEQVALSGDRGMKSAHRRALSATK